jgi:serine/threonine-protein kinase
VAEESHEADDSGLEAEPHDRPSLPGVQVGAVLLGKYRVERILGEGGMGVVVAARHLSLDRPVAIKLIRKRAQASDEALSRFQREARAAAKIESEHVGRVLDVDRLPDGAPFIVMELLEGNDLADELAARGKLPVEEAIAYILQASEAVGEAHAAGIIHRDLKPANLFLARRPGAAAPIVKVLDFGISKVTRHEPSTAEDAINKTLTNPSSLLGSPLYMSPEQMRASVDVDGRTDIWSLGVILYELVTGRSPFDANTVPLICAHVLGIPTPPMNVEGLPDGLEAVIRRALEKERDERYRDVAHWVRALVPFAPEQGPVSLGRVSRFRTPDGEVYASPATIPPPPVSSEKHDAPPPAIEDELSAPVTASESSPRSSDTPGEATVTSWADSEQRSSRRRWIPFALVSVSLLVLIAGALSLRGPEPSPSSNPAEVRAGSSEAAAGDDHPIPPIADVVPSAPKPVIPSASLPVSSPSASVSPPATASSASAGSSPGIQASPSSSAVRPAAKKGPSKKNGTDAFGGRE